MLGGMLLSKAAVDDVAQVLTGADFSQPRHELIFDAALAVAGDGHDVDVISVLDYLTRAGEVGRAGGAPYLHQLIQAIPSAANAGFYAQLVADRAVERRLTAAGQRIADLAGKPGDTAAKAAAAQAFLTEALDSRPAASSAGRTLGEDLDEYLDQLENAPVQGLMWPFLDLNLALNPLTPGQLIIVGARPAVGKTSFGLDVARDIAIRQQLPVVFHSLEMSRKEITDRVVSAEARVPLTNLIGHTATDEHWLKIAKAQSALSEAPLIIDDTARLTLGDLRASVRRHKPRLVVVDYLQLATLNPGAQSRREALEEFSRGLKILAKAEQVPVIALAQLNRGPELRADKRPYMSDLREAGAIEQDGDVILLLHREDMHDKDSNRAGEADVIIAKQRNGGTSTVALGAQLHFARFCDLARRW